ncbi:phospholipase D family protein [Chitinibacteraceae bacterium HSL-7]
MRRPSLAALISLSSLLGACAQLPSVPPGTARPTGTAPSPLIESVSHQTEQHPGLSGVSPLRQGRTALLSRLALANAATRSLDVQYYIWHNDLTGRLLLWAILDAADRGVSVRVLLDDLGTNPDDKVLRTLATHDNIEVRLFNPVAWRSWRKLGLVWEVGRLNQRMHNKSFTADGVASIVGGRNVGNEYFEANKQVDFSDLDVVAIGPVVDEVAQAFEEYWQHSRAIPIEAFYRRAPNAEALSQLRTDLGEALLDDRGADYNEHLKAEAERFRQAGASLPFYWGEAHAVYDDPDKLVRDDARKLTDQLAALANNTEHQLDIISPYFVPKDSGVDWLAERVERGARVRVLTNSLAATDVAAVHAGYSPARQPLLDAGVQLYELKPDPQVRQRKRTKWLGSSRASLHAKSFLFDQRHVFVGSLNLDPRSIDLNTEIGIVIDNAQLAAELTADFEDMIANDAYRLTLDPNGSLLWHDDLDGSVRDTEPQTNWLQRLGVRLMSLLPIKSQL